MNAISEPRAPKFSEVEKIGSTFVARSSHLDDGTHSWDAAFSPACLPALIRCYHRVRAWRLPPNWSFADWSEEVKEVLCVAAAEAERDFDSARGVSFDAFLYHRAAARVLTRYRQEWNYGTRFLSEGTVASADMEEDSDFPSMYLQRRRVDAEDVTLDEMPLEELTLALATLPPSSRRLIELLFWKERAEHEVAREFGISQPAISQQKHAILRVLRRRMAAAK